MEGIADEAAEEGAVNEAVDGMRKAQLLTVVSWQAAALTVAALIAGIPLGILAGRWSWALFAVSVGVDPSIKVPVLPLVAETGAALLLAIIIGYPRPRRRPGKARASPAYRVTNAQRPTRA